LHFFALAQNSTLLFSSDSALFAQNTRGGGGAHLLQRASRRGGTLLVKLYAPQEEKGRIEVRTFTRHGRKKKAATLKVAAAQTMASRATSLRLGWDEFPTRVGVVLGHGRGKLAGVGAEIFLVDAALLINDEGHYAGIAPFVGIGDERVTGDRAPGCNCVRARL